MNKNLVCALLILLSLSFYPALLQAAENTEPAQDQADEKSEERPLSAVASSVKDVGASPAGLVRSTVEETKSGPPIVGTLKGIERGAGDLTRTAVKGVSNIVTFGHSQQSELEPSAVGTEHKDPAKFKIRIPGT